VAVDLLLQVTRGADNRLSGTVRSVSGSEAHTFSGTLELMRAFEELVPVQPTAADSGGPGWPQPAPTNTSPLT
jgi:hypothetical protein